MTAQVRDRTMRAWLLVLGCTGVALVLLAVAQKKGRHRA